MHVGSLVFVMLSNPRLMPGHLLVVPKRHVETLAELNVEERRELFDTAIEFQGQIMERLAPGCDIRQHCRPFLPEGRLKVHHVHLHLLPRALNDELYQKVQKFEQEVFEEFGEEEREEMTKILKRGIKGGNNITH